MGDSSPHCNSMDFIPPFNIPAKDFLSTLSPDLCSLVEQLLWEEDDYRNNRKRFRNPGKVKGLRNYKVGIYSISDCRDGFCFEGGLFSIEYRNNSLLIETLPNWPTFA